MKKHFLLLAILSLLTLGAFAQIGSSCSTPDSLGSNDTCVNNISVNGPEYWFSFTPSATREIITIASHTGGGIGHVHRLYFYTSCSAAAIDSSDVNGNDSIYLSLEGLTVGNTYFLKASTLVPGCPTCNAKANFNICVSVLSIACAWTGGYPCNQEQLGNTSFEFIDPNTSGQYWNAGCVNDINMTQTGEMPTCPWIGMPLPAFVSSNVDIYNTCATTNGFPQVGVPSNCFGVQNPHSGSGYAGIFALVQSNTGNTFEGLEQDFPPLTAGRVYYEEMWVSLAEASSLATTIGFFETNGSNSAPVSFYYHPTNITNMNGWTHVQHCFTAVGTEATLWITWNGASSFMTGYPTPVAVTPTVAPCLFFPPTTAYYYIDDVSIRPVADAGPDQTICTLGPVALGCAYKPIIGATYSWTVSPTTGVTIANPNSQATTASFTTPGVYTFTLTVNSPQCGIVTDQVVMTVAPILGSITGPTTTCGLSTANYTAPSGMTSYSWSVVLDNNTPVPFTSCGANCININWAGFLSADCKCTATITCNMANSAGCTASMNLFVGACCQPGGISYYVDPTTSSPPFNVPVLINGTYAINGTFAVNSNITFQGFDLEMGPQSQIHVTNGATLTIVDNGSSDPSHLFGCCDLWKGITLDPGTSLVLNNSSIEDAEVAITSNGCANYTISNNAILNKNFENIIVTQCASHPGTIQQSTISCRDNATSKTYASTPPNTLRCLKSGQKTYTGIETTDVGSIAVGNPVSGLTNTFDNMTLGIVTVRSTITIKNNLFKNIKQVPFLPTGIAIWSLGFTPSASPFVLTVGGPGVNDPNSFLNCSNGVRTDNSMNILIQNNNFNLLTGVNDNGIGVYSQNDISPFFGPAHTVRVVGNTMIKFKTGIQTRFTSNTKVAIQNNALNPVASANPSQRGIVVGDASNFPNGFVKVQANSISNVKFGITATNIFGLLIDQVNTITFPINIINPAINIYGIWVQNSPSTLAPSTIAHNTVTKNGVGGNAASSGNWLGIRVDNTANVTVDWNTINRMGTGINVRSSCPNSTLACNIFNTCYYGFNFIGPADIGDQLPNSIPQANQWIANNQTLFGAIFPTVTWNYNNVGNLIPIPNFTLAPLSLTNGNNPTITGLPDICGTLPLFANPTPAERHQLFASIIHNSKQFSDNAEENKFWNKQYVHEFFRMHPNALTLNDTSDTGFQNFYNLVNSGNFGTFADINDMISSENVGQAINLNNSIYPTSILESNKQTVNSIYLNTIANGVFNYSPADSATLLNIALQNPLIGGDGVYKARVMLDLIVMDDDQNNQRIAAPVLSAQETKYGKVYPNPASNQATLDYMIEDGQTGKMEIYSLLGQKKLSFNLKPNENLIFSTESLEAGIYIYAVYINGEMQLTDKIVIMK